MSCLETSPVNVWWQQVWLVMAGGALGSLGRFLIGGWLTRQLGTGFPWGTLAANFIGAFAAGYLLIWLEGREPSALLWRAFLIVGLLGGLTTFSALMLESLLFARTGRSEMLLIYLAVSMLGGLSMVWMGARLAEYAR